MIYFCNDQWAVTDQGLEHQGFPEYVVGMDDVAGLQDFSGQTVYHFPVHMASKTWVNIELLFTAFLYALVHHAGAYQPPVDMVIVRDTLDLARALAPTPGEK
jgi:hypothetical protein